MCYDIDAKFCCFAKTFSAGMLQAISDWDAMRGRRLHCWPKMMEMAYQWRAARLASQGSLARFKREKSAEMGTSPARLG